MILPKYAKTSDGVIDVVSYYPDRDETGDILPPWVPVPDEVFAGFIQISDGTFTPPPPPDPTPPTIADYENAIQALVDATPKDKLFRDGVTLASYVNSTDPQWAAEAVAFVAWRDGVWRYAYAELEKVQGGLRPQPSVEDFLSEIVPIDWPEPAPA